MGNPMAFGSPLFQDRVPKAMALMSRLSLWGRKVRSTAKRRFGTCWRSSENEPSVQIARSSYCSFVFKGSSGSGLEIPPLLPPFFSRVWDYAFAKLISSAGTERGG